VRVGVETSPAETSLAAMGHAELGRVEPGRVQMGPAETSPVELHLAGRRDVFAGPTDSAYAPTGSQLSIQADQDVPARIALCTARAARTLPARYIRADETVAEVRGAGTSSRRVTNYTLGTGVPVDHLLVCEVVTPGGNVSSYPPHKHDEHTDVERELEEIYYYEVADGLHGQAGAVAYHRNYAGPGRPLDILAEVRTGDVALVPHGFHGPVVTLPGYDVYYLNVMAGPATDGRWLMVDDPQYHWVRQTWAHQSVDPRLLPPISMSRIET
jgi:5-deoxy-glucuronate isomerase